jgi:predicted SAM-dependent methyltransferase
MTITKIDIGCMDRCTAGFEPWDIAQGRDARALVGIPDGSLEVVKASHVLEHIPHRETLAVLREWNRALRVGGTLLVAVPDFDRCVDAYARGVAWPVEQYIMGGQTDANDFHAAIFNRQKLTDALASAGFEVVGDWAGDSNSCSSLPVSLNIRAVKRAAGVLRRAPVRPLPDMHAVMSMPRLAWTENMGCCYTALGPLHIPFVRSIGVFWGQCLQRLFQQIAEGGKHKYVLAIDYDTIFDAHDVCMLRDIADAHDLDILCPLQIGRDRNQLLAKIDDGMGLPVSELAVERLADDHWPVLHGHFGLTLIRCDRLREFPMPWFVGEAGAKGDWGNDRVDDDVYFWKKARAAGWRISTTPQVRVGHLQVVASWPDRNLNCVHQFMHDYHTNGKPDWTLPPT